MPLDHYPVPTKLTEGMLFHGYRGVERRTGSDRRERPVEPLYDESGLLYGEPISEGRTRRQGGTRA